MGFQSVSSLLTVIALSSVLAEEPEWAEPFECPRYSISVDSITLHHAETSIDKYRVFMTLKFHDRQNDDKLGAVQQVSGSISGMSDAGPVRLFAEHQNIGRVTKRTGSMSFSLMLPATATMIKELECKFLLVYPAPVETLTWDLPVAVKGETKRFGDFKFTLDDATIESKRAQFIYSFNMPVSSDQAKNWPREFMKTKIIMADGSEAQGSGGGTSNHGNQTIAFSKQLPKSFSFVFVPSIRQEEAHFKLENIPLPVSKGRAGEKPATPAGVRSSVSDGTTIELNDVTVHRSNLPQRDTIRIFTRHVPKTFKNAGEFRELKSAIAVDDKDRTLTVVGAPFTHWPAADFKLPDKEVRRIKSFRGVYTMLTVDTVEKFVFELPPESDKFEKKRGPITFTSVTYGTDRVNVEFEVNIAALPSAEWLKRSSSQSTGKSCAILGMDFDLIDNAEQACKCTGTNSTNRPGWHQVKVSYTGVPKSGAKLEIFFPTKGHAAEVPFEFKDIDLPVFTEKPKRVLEQQEF